MRALLYSHFFLSLGAIALIAETAFIFKFWNEQTIEYICFVFFSTLVAYNIKGILAIFRKENTIIHSEKINWARSNRISFVSFYSLSVLTAILFFTKFPFPIYPMLFLVGVIAVFYSLPLRVGNYYFSPRYVPFLKTMLVAFVWAIVVVYLPCRINNVPFPDFRFWVIGEFVFLFSLAILFDIKDVKEDATIGIKTFPQKLGVNVTKILSVVLMGSRVIWLVFQGLDNFPILLESAFCFIYLIYIVTFINTTREEKFYMGWIDGLMLVKFLLFLVSNIV